MAVLNTAFHFLFVGKVYMWSQFLSLVNIFSGFRLEDKIQRSTCGRDPCVEGNDGGYFPIVRQGIVRIPCLK